MFKICLVASTTIFLIAGEGPVPPFKEKYPREGFVLPLPDWDTQFASHILNGWPKGRSPFDLGKRTSTFPDEELPPKPPPEKFLPSESPSPTPTFTPTQNRDYRRYEIPPSFLPPGQCIPRPECVMPSQGPTEGGIRVTIQGTFLARNIEDVEEILICGSPCVDVQIEEFTECVSSGENRTGIKRSNVVEPNVRTLINPCWFQDLPENELGGKIDRSDKYIYRHRDKDDDQLCIFESYVVFSNVGKRFLFFMFPLCQLNYMNVTSDRSVISQESHSTIDR